MLQHLRKQRIAIVDVLQRRLINEETQQRRVEEQVQIRLVKRRQNRVDGLGNLLQTDVCQHGGKGLGFGQLVERGVQDLE